MLKKIIACIITLIFVICPVGANTVVKEITFDDWELEKKYKSGVELPDPDLILYHSVNQTADILSVVTMAKHICVGIANNNTYLILFLRKGLLSFDLYGSSTGVTLSSAIENSDGGWKAGSVIDKELIGAVTSNSWGTYTAAIPEDGWYCFKCSKDIYLDNIKNEIIGFNLEGYVRDTDGVAIEGASVSIDGVVSGTTDGDGHYLISCEEWELCEISISAPGYETVSEKISISSDLSKDFTLSQKTLSLNVVLADETDKRLSDATIYIYGMELANRGNGIYSIECLPAAKLGVAEWPLTIVLDGYRIFGDVNVCFDYDSRGVSLLAVREHSYSITGRVINEWNVQVANAEVELLYNGERIEESVYTDDNGEFTMLYTPVHFTPAEISDAEFVLHRNPCNSACVSAADMIDSGKIMAPERVESAADGTGYQIRISQGSLYHPGAIDIPTPSAGSNVYALDEPVKMDSDTITIVEMTSATSALINGKRFPVEPNSVVFTVQGIAVTRLLPGMSINLPAGIYIVAGEKIVVK